MTDLKNQEWSRHSTDIYQAVKDGLPRNIAQLKQGLNDDDAWAQEFELQWLDEASSWLSYELIDGVEHPQAGKPEHYTGNPCFVGMDIAVRGDLTVIWVIELVGDIYWTREIITLKRVALREQLGELDRVFNQYHVIACYLDQTGMGEKMVEDAQYQHGKRGANRTACAPCPPPTPQPKTDRRLLKRAQGLRSMPNRNKKWETKK